MISIVLPAYNEEKYISGCLDSLVRQKTKQQFEVVLVDNNSTDRTVPRAEKYKKRLKLRIVHESRQGILHARNRGFDEARGDVIARIDADSQAHPDWVEKIYENFQDDEVVGLAGTFLAHDMDGLSQSPVFIRCFFRFMYSLAGQPLLFGFNCALRRSAWKKIRKKTEKMSPLMHEDFHLAILLSRVGKIHYDEHLLVRTSSRRLQDNKLSFLVVYPIMSIITLVWGYYYRAINTDS